MENETKKQGNYLTGIIGAIIGGFIATIPWVLAYVYGNMMLSLLAVLIAAGEFYGYKLCKGKIDKKLPVIIMILAIIIVSVTTLIIIPAWLLAKEGLPVTLQSIKNLYSFSDFSTAIIKDYLITVIFTVLGASVVTSSIKKQLANNVEDINLTVSNTEEQTKIKESAIKVIKPIFEKYNAKSQENSMTKEEVFAEVEDKNKNIYFKELTSYGIIKKYKGKYFYQESEESSIKKKPSTGKIVGITIGILVIIFAIVAIFTGGTGTNLIQNSDIKFEIPSNWNVYNEYSTEEGWSYYRYINSVPSYENQETNTIDYSAQPAVINVNYDHANADGENTIDSTTENFASIDEVKTVVEAYIKESIKPEQYDINVVTSKNGYQTVKAKMQYESDPEEIDYYYYIYRDGKLAYLTGYTFNTKDDAELENTLDSILDSFAWQY